MIRPHLEYVDFIIESGSKALVSKLDRLQERAIRRIEYCKKKTESRKEYSVLQQEYNIECLSMRRNYNLLGYMYHQSKDEINIVSSKCDRILRSKRKRMLKYNFSKLTKLHNSPFYRGVKAWNRLPREIQGCKTKMAFRKMIKNFTVQKT